MHKDGTTKGCTWEDGPSLPLSPKGRIKNCNKPERIPVDELKTLERTMRIIKVYSCRACHFGKTTHCNHPKFTGFMWFEKITSIPDWCPLEKPSNLVNTPDVCECGEVKDIIYCGKCEKVWQVY